MENVGNTQTKDASVSADYADIDMVYPVGEVPTHDNSCKVGNGTIPTGMEAPSPVGDACC